MRTALPTGAPSLYVRACVTRHATHPPRRPQTLCKRVAAGATSAAPRLADSMSIVRPRPCVPPPHCAHPYLPRSCYPAWRRRWRGRASWRGNRCAWLPNHNVARTAACCCALLAVARGGGARAAKVARAGEVRRAARDGMAAGDGAPRRRRRKSRVRRRNQSQSPRRTPARRLMMTPCLLARRQRCARESGLARETKGMTALAPARRWLR